MTAAFRVIKPGFQTTVQDLGRFGYRHLGVPISGGIDSFALMMANILTGNETGAPCLETALQGPELYFLKDTVIAITGADMEPRLSGKPIPMWESVLCKAGETLKLGYRRSGCRSYIAFAGGIKVPEILGSCSTFLTAGFGGVNGRCLQAGDLLETCRYAGQRGLLLRVVPEKYRPEYHSPFCVRVIKGINADNFEESEYKKLYNQTFTVTNRCNRMGCFVNGLTSIGTNADPILESYPVIPGTIQVPSSGNPIVLLNDAQATGGYPQIGCVISSDIWKLGQMIPGDKLKFEETNIKEALETERVQNETLRKIGQEYKQRYIYHTRKNTYEVIFDRTIMKENN